MSNIQFVAGQRKPDGCLLAALGLALLPTIVGFVSLLGYELCSWQAGPFDWDCCVTLFMLICSALALHFRLASRWTVSFPAVGACGLLYDFLGANGRVGKMTTPWIALAWGLGMAAILFAWANATRPRLQVFLVGLLMSSQVIGAMVWQDRVAREQYMPTLQATSADDGKLVADEIFRVTGYRLPALTWSRGDFKPGPRWANYREVYGSRGEVKANGYFMQNRIAFTFEIPGQRDLTSAQLAGAIKKVGFSNQFIYALQQSAFEFSLPTADGDYDVKVVYAQDGHWYGEKNYPGNE